MVFNNKYVQRNVLKGIELTRDNKINITQYILGEENIIHANEISDLKRKRGEINKKLSTLRDSIQKIIPKDVSVDDFLELVIEDDYKTKLDRYRKKQEKIEETIKNTKNILSINPINEINTDTNIQEYFPKINTLLNTTYDDINDMAYKRIVTHIQSNFSRLDSSAESWIKQGTENYLKEEQGKCPYCGQELLAFELVRAYKKYFSESYQEYCTRIIDELRGLYKQIRDKIKALNYEDTKRIQLNLANLCLVIQDNEFISQVRKLEGLANEYETQLNEYISILSGLMDQIELKAKHKKAKPYCLITGINLSELEASMNRIRNSEASFNEAVRIINLNISSLKRYIVDDSVQEDLMNVKNAVAQYELQELRAKSNELCNDYTKLNDEYEQSKRTINHKQVILKKIMDDFLAYYFGYINYYLNVFGTKNFQIERTIQTSGNLPVISLCLSFKGVKVDEKNIHNALSESDIRALALAIFWAKLKVKNEESLAKTIVVLDDPIVSFDTSRMKQAALEINQINEKCRQVILLTHYETFIKAIYDNTNNKHSPKLIRISKGPATHYLENAEIGDYIIQK